MSVLRAEDIVAADGDVAEALKQKRQEAADHLEKTRKLPAWWELGISLGSVGFKGKKGPPPKFVDPDDFLSQAFDYFEQCAIADKMPTKSGLVIAMGFFNFSQFMAYPRRNIEYRPAFAKVLTLLQIPYEMAVPEAGGQAGKIFILKNLPEGLLPEDPVDKPVQYLWKDRQTTEHTGADGGPLEISPTLPPEEMYRKMLENGNAILADAGLIEAPTEGEGEGDELGNAEDAALGEAEGEAIDE